MCAPKKKNWKNLNYWINPLGGAWRAHTVRYRARLSATRCTHLRWPRATCHQLLAAAPLAPSHRAQANAGSTWPHRFSPAIKVFLCDTLFPFSYLLSLLSRPYLNPTGECWLCCTSGHVRLPEAASQPSASLWLSVRARDPHQRSEPS
jgi:hypothetical protein